MKPSKIVLSIYKNDYKFLTRNLKDMINNNNIELIVTDINLKNHNKYFEVMKKYRDYAIIVINDDRIYSNDLIKTLYNSYIDCPNCIHSRNVNKIMSLNNEILSYNKWLKEYTFELNPSFNLLAITASGTLFPPNILDISNENINEIKKCLTEEDIYLKYLSMKRNIKIKWAPNKNLLRLRQLKDINSQDKILYEMNEKEENLKNKCLLIFNTIK